MFNRDNAIGILLLGFCALVGGYMVYVIATGKRVSIHLNGTAGLVLTLVFIGLIIYGIVRSGTFSGFGGGNRDGRGRQWPDPRTGQSGQRRSWWDRLRGR
jgi:heme A synthase